MNNTKVYLVDTADTPVTYKTWTLTGSNGYSCYMIPGDTLVRSVAYSGFSISGGAAHCGKVQKVTWGGTIAWDFTYSSSTYGSHHDFCPLPNGNVLLISFDVKTAADATQAGCSSSTSLLSEKIVEIHPTGATTGTIVWEWKLWDHLCQNNNSAKDNYVTSIVNNPQLMNINYGSGSDRWHMNGIDYNAELDQIVVSMHNVNELYVIDHSTTTAQAATHTGGNSGKGGDFLYRWGNPAAYGGTGTANFNVIHDAHWTSATYTPCPNCIAAYNNKGGTSSKTAIDIVTPPMNGSSYTSVAGSPATYTKRQATTFAASNQGGSEQFPNGNMLICNPGGSIYEVNAAGTSLWTKSASAAQAHRYTKCFIRGPIASATVSATTVCAGNPLTLGSSANSVTETSTNYTYEWTSIPAGFTSTTQNPTLNPTQSSTYKVIITNTLVGCSDTATVAVTVNPTPTIPTITLNGETLNSSTATQYQWYLNGNIIANANSQNYTPTESGSYQVEITDNNGCTSISQAFAYSNVSINSIADNKTIIYPNPTTGIINITNELCESNNFEVTIYNTYGHSILSYKNANSIDISKFNNGIYYMIVKLCNNKIITKKINLLK